MLTLPEPTIDQWHDEFRIVNQQYIRRPLRFSKQRLIPQRIGNAELNTPGLARPQHLTRPP